MLKLYKTVSAEPGGDLKWGAVPAVPAAAGCAVEISRFVLNQAAHRPGAAGTSAAPLAEVVLDRKRVRVGELENTAIIGYEVIVGKVGVSEQISLPVERKQIVGIVAIGWLVGKAIEDGLGSVRRQLVERAVINIRAAGIGCAVKISRRIASHATSR